MSREWCPTLDKSLIDGLSFNPYAMAMRSGLGQRVVVDGRRFIDLASNNYLGLALDPRVIDGARRGLERFGASMCGTPVATGNTDWHEALVRRLARFVGFEDGALLPSCYQLGSGLLRAVATPSDCVLIDHYAHASLVDGARASGCKIRPWRHNDLASLEQNLERSRAHPRRFVLTESVFSTEGVLAPLRGIVELCRGYDAILVIDDSHGIGVIGPGGRGALRRFELDGYDGIYLASLGKALAGAGGIVGAPRALVEYLRYTTPSLIYSTGLPPASVGGLLAALDVMEEEGDARVRRLRSLHSRIGDALRARGFSVARVEAPINAVVTGGARETVHLAQALWRRGVLSTPFVSPSVPRGRGTVRLIAGAHLDDETIDEVLGIIGGLDP